VYCSANRIVLARSFGAIVQSGSSKPFRLAADTQQLIEQLRHTLAHYANSTSTLQASMHWNSFFGMSQVTAPNGNTAGR
jgi:hypothetical protein